MAFVVAVIQITFALPRQTFSEAAIAPFACRFETFAHDSIAAVGRAPLPNAHAEASGRHSVTGSPLSASLRGKLICLLGGQVDRAALKRSSTMFVRKPRRVRRIRQLSCRAERFGSFVLSRDVKCRGVANTCATTNASDARWSAEERRGGHREAATSAGGRRR